MQQIIHNIPLIAAKTNSSFAASLAMVLSWKLSEEQKADDVLDNQLFYSTANVMVKNKGMAVLSSLPVKLEPLSQLIFQSPVLCAFFNGEKLLYAVVITGILGDGSLTETYIHIQDPKGIKYKVALGEFYQSFSRAVSASNGIEIKDTQQLFCYCDASMTVTTVHHSYSSHFSSRTNH